MTETPKKKNFNENFIPGSYLLEGRTVGTSRTVVKGEYTGLMSPGVAIGSFLALLPTQEDRNYRPTKGV